MKSLNFKSLIKLKATLINLKMALSLDIEPLQADKPEKKKSGKPKVRAFVARFADRIKSKYSQFFQVEDEKEPDDD